MGAYDEWVATEARLPGESPTRHMIRGIVAAIALGLDEAGVPLTDDQHAFLGTIGTDAAA